MKSVVVIFLLNALVSIFCTRCMEKDGKAGLNEECHDKYGCHRSYMLSLYENLKCVDNICQCPSGTLVRNSTDRLRVLAKSYCKQLPSYGEKCDPSKSELSCAPPMMCFKGRCRCPDGLTFTGETQEQRANSDRLLFCKKECAPGEFLVPDIGICRKCKVNEIRISDECKPIGRLGQFCQHSRQCSVGFSWCKNAICVCKPGFSQQNDICISKVVSCPMARDSPLLDSKGNMISCTRSLEYHVSALLGVSVKLSELLQNDDSEKSRDTKRMIIKDSCPPTHTCTAAVVVSSGDQTGTETGWCCQKHEPTCPIGVPLEGVSCPLPFDDQSASCPRDSHFCVYNPEGNDRLCCPKPCNSDSEIFADQKCLPKVSLGEQCTYESQCNGDGLCVNGVCQCHPNSISFETKCLCKMTEVMLNRRCYKRLEIGDKCIDQMVCPLGSICFEGKCDCPCGMQSVGKHYCVEKPNCPSMTGDFNVNEDPVFCINNKLLERYPTEITWKRNWTNIEGLEIVDHCPNNYYCSTKYRAFSYHVLLNSYINYMKEAPLALCCPLTGPLCPDSLSPIPNKMCDPIKPDVCPEDSFCFGVSDDTKFVCCPYSKERKGGSLLGSLPMEYSYDIYCYYQHPYKTLPTKMYCPKEEGCCEERCCAMNGGMGFD